MRRTRKEGSRQTLGPFLPSILYHTLLSYGNAVFWSQVTHHYSFFLSILIILSSGSRPLAFAFFLLPTQHLLSSWGLCLRRLFEDVVVCASSLSLPFLLAFFVFPCLARC